MILPIVWRCMVAQLNRKLRSVDIRNPKKVLPNWLIGTSLLEYSYWNNEIPGETPDYRLATGVILTFLVNNKLDKSELEPALEWERK